MGFDINKDLDIILITYNRIDKLKKIVSDIFSDDSPIKKCKITFLDNCSTDGTSKFIDELSDKYDNVIHVKHKINISGIGNILRSLEYIQKKYFWILCDDDRLDFTHWKIIENALKTDKYDIIQTYTFPLVFSGETYEDKVAKLIVENMFLPASIYRSKYITSEVVFNAYINAYALVPHMAFIASIINNNGKIYFCEEYDKQILVQYPEEVANYKRGYKREVHPIYAGMDLSVGFIISLSLIKDKKIRYKCIDRVRSYAGLTFEGYLGEMPYYWIHAGMNDNLITIYDNCNDIQKQSFIERLVQIKKEFQKYNRNSLITFSFHILYTHEIRKRFFNISFLGFSISRNREYPKIYSLFSIRNEIYYIRFKILFFINLVIKK
ncbi:glycosyltransferase [Brachyspira intermedia]|uniref:glycosyltransferase n=1 Tax=Brachyspira intermedia TaxID=84377 RepID=UPI003004FD53